MKHHLISQFYTLFTHFVFNWVVEVYFIDYLAYVLWWWRGVEGSAVCFVDCLAHVLWQWRGVGAESLLVSFFMALLLCIDSSVTSAALICITAYVQCFSIFYCFAAQCCFITAHCIVMICKHTFFTFTFLNSEGFQHVDLMCLYLQQLDLLTEFINYLHNCATERLTTCKRESMTKLSICKKGITHKYINILNYQ